MSSSEHIRRAVEWAMRRRPRRRGGWTDEVGYKSPQEVALENAAESLGVTLGEYYAEDLDLSHLPSTPDAGGGADARVDASREELLTYVDGLRTKRKRRLRQRGLRVAGAVAVLLFVIAVGPALLSDSDQDGRVVGGDPKRGTGGRPAMSVSTALPPIGTSVSSELPDGDGKIVNSTYLNRYGDLCSVLIESRDGFSEQNTGGGCVSPARAATDLRRQPAYAISIHALARRTVIQGYARTDVERIAGRSVWGDIEAAVSPAWSPDGSDRLRPLPLKTFLVVAPRRGGGRVTGDPLRTTLDYRNYNLRAGLRDGRVVPVGSPMSHGPEHRNRLFDPIATASTERRRSPQDANHRSE